MTLTHVVKCLISMFEYIQQLKLHCNCGKLTWNIKQLVSETGVQ